MTDRCSAFATHPRLNGVSKRCVRIENHVEATHVWFEDPSVIGALPYVVHWRDGEAPVVRVAHVTIDPTERRIVWDDETMPPGTTATDIALSVTDADPDLVGHWVDSQRDHAGDWMTYAQWLRAEPEIQADIADMDDGEPDGGYLERVRAELAKLA
jgi:hypothetical protein